MSNTLRPHELQHARPPCLSTTPRVYWNPCPLNQWCHPTISSSVIPFFSCLQSFTASGSFPVSQFFVLGSKNRKQKSRMAVAKRQGREKPVKTEQRKVQEPEWGPQAEQTALLPSPFYIWKTQGEEKAQKEEPKGQGSLSRKFIVSVFFFSLSYLCVFRSAWPHASRMYFPIIF